jgi:hypothetical protein
MLTLQTLPDDPCETPNGGGLRRAIEEEVDPTVFVYLRRQEERGLALVNPGQPTGVVSVFRRKGRDPFGVLKQGLALEFMGRIGESVHDLLEFLGK